MNTGSLQNNTLSAEDFAWLENKCRAVDAMDAEKYSAFLADDCVLQFGNGPQAQGKSVMLEGIQQFWGGIAGLNHHFLNVHAVGNTVMLEAMIDYSRKDGQVVTVPFVTLMDRDAQGLVTSLRIFIDLAPLFA